MSDEIDTPQEKGLEVTNVVLALVLDCLEAELEAIEILDHLCLCCLPRLVLVPQPFDPQSCGTAAQKVMHEILDRGGFPAQLLLGINTVLWRQVAHLCLGQVVYNAELYALAQVQERFLIVAHSLIGSSLFLAGQKQREQCHSVHVIGNTLRFFDAVVQPAGALVDLEPFNAMHEVQHFGIVCLFLLSDLIGCQGVIAGGVKECERCRS